ncbi:hypothetical protein ACPYO6_04095 [Georgenia sp. Z1344]|uniref:hypothetical protein n=1 Tax=Georgenia sp. Z1344 TaxID=3416706 RepID=UPI003CF92945
MNIVLEPEVLRARVNYLDTVVTELTKLNDDMNNDGVSQQAMWSELSTVSRIGSPLATATFDLATGVTELLRSADNIRLALVRAAENLAETDETLMADLEAIGEQIDEATPPPPPGPRGGPTPIAV